MFTGVPIGTISYNSFALLLYMRIHPWLTAWAMDHGYSRDQKPDKKQINLNINTNVMGIPLVYSLLSGETADKSTVIDNMENIIKTLNKSNRTADKPLVVGDRAMLDNKIVVAYHKRQDLDYLGTLKLTKDMKEAIAATVILSTLGLPIEGLAIVFGVDVIIDMARTATNVAGASVTALLVAVSENEFDKEAFSRDDIDELELDVA